MVRIIVLSLLLSTMMPRAFAQQDRKAQIDRLRVAFITEELDLSVEESQEFWPVFNAFRDQKKALERDQRRSIRDAQNKPSITEEELLNLNRKIQLSKKELVEIEAQLIEDLIPILGAERCLALMTMEADFRKRILRERLERE
jgi:hypothetical protein